MQTKHIDWTAIRTIHFVGIKGVAMTALAVWAKESGFVVTGSDTDEKFPTDEILEQKGISVYESFDSEHVVGDIIIYTGAHGGRDNVEVIEAKKRGIPVFPHGVALGEAMKTKRRISIAGCHGKTTTTAMIASIICNSGKDPSYAIGSGMIRGLGLPGHAGKGEWFIAEADEYVTEPHHDMTPRFLWQLPELLVITNIEFDHPDVYENIDEIKLAYRKLIESTQKKRIIIFNEDDKNTSECINVEGVIPLSFGFSEHADFQIVDTAYRNGNNIFSLFHKGNKIGPFSVKVPGTQNIANAAASVIACHFIGLSWTEIVEGLSSFYGAKRRFELLGTFHDAICFDDYAHHPTEISVTIASAKQWYPKSNIFVIFQPHTFSRTKALISEFGKSFGENTKVFILPIYASAREKTGVIDEKDLVQEIAKINKKVGYYSTLDEAFNELSNIVKTGDILLFMGAGDIGRRAREYIQKTL